MATQTQTVLETDINCPERAHSMPGPSDSGNIQPCIESPKVNPMFSPVLEPMQVELPDQAPEGTTVFTTPNARAVKGQLSASYYALLIAGLNDAATGTLIPFLQPAYGIGLLDVAILYLVSFAGWIVAAFTNVFVMSRLGRGGVLVLGALFQLLAYGLMFWKPPFALFAASFFFSGLGIAYQDAQTNAFVANVENAYRWLGWLHAAYGLGALIAPLIATTIAATTPHWNHYYAIMLGLAALDVGFLGYAFRKSLFRRPAKTAKDTAGKELKTALTQKVVWILSLYFLLYVGAEVTSGGWVVQFLVSIRNGEAGQVGYVATGFWSGLTLGRVLLADIINKLGERRMVLILIACALGLQFLFWFVPNIIADAVFISILGFCIAPFFPVGISVLTKLLPRELHVAAVGFTATVGQAGSAAFPFLTGAIASNKGVQVLQPIMVALLGGMFVSWCLLPRVQKPAQ